MKINLLNHTKKNKVRRFSSNEIITRRLAIFILFLIPITIVMHYSLSILREDVHVLEKEFNLLNVQKKTVSKNLLNHSDIIKNLEICNKLSGRNRYKMDLFKSIFEKIPENVQLLKCFEESIQNGSKYTLYVQLDSFSAYADLMRRLSSINNLNRIKRISYPEKDKVVPGLSYRDSEAANIHQDKMENHSSGWNSFVDQVQNQAKIDEQAFKKNSRDESLNELHISTVKIELEFHENKLKSVDVLKTLAKNPKKGGRRDSI